MSQPQPPRYSPKTVQLISLTLGEQIGRHIRARRRILRLTQAEAAQLIGTSQTALARLEKGQGNPTLDLIQRTVDALGMQATIFVRARQIEPQDFRPEPQARG